VPADAESVLFTLVDHPAVAPATLDALLAGPGPRDSVLPQPHSLTLGARIGAPTVREGLPPTTQRHLVRVPRHQGRRGHPIWFSRELIAEFLGLQDLGAAREIVRCHAAQTEFLDVDDPGILADIDDPAAYGRLTGAPL